MIKMRKAKSKHRACDSCRKTEKVHNIQMFEIYIGTEKDGKIISLCDGCMHELLTKLIAMGKANEVQ